MKDVRLNLSAMYLMFRFEDEIGHSVIQGARIETFNHNVVINSILNSELFSKLMVEYHIEPSIKNPKVADSPLHLVSEDFLIVINNPIFERLEMNTGNMMFNIIADSIDYFEHPVLYIRKTKIEKIKENIKWKKGKKSVM